MMDPNIGKLKNDHHAFFKLMDEVCVINIFFSSKSYLS